MTQCSNKRRSAGLAYPRTCSVCGLGPCRETSALNPPDPPTNTVKHTPTPGPWFADEDAGYVYSRPGPLTRFVIAASESGTMDEQIANVRLMAAAPDFLAALREIAELGSDGEHSGDRHARCREIARAAISKASGSPAPQEKGGA